MREQESSEIDIIKVPQTYEELSLENNRLLIELELAYTHMEHILEESDQERQITYRELERKLKLLEKLYDELSKKENMLIHMEKLSSIGTFIAEIVHELRNPLNAINIQVQLALMNDIPIDVQERFKIIDDNTKKMSNLLQRFRTMAYKVKEDFELFDLNKNVAECLESIEIIKPKSLSIEMELCDQQLLVNGDPYQINQIFFNLAKNAFDAMTDRGKRLRIKTEKVSPDFFNDSEQNNYISCQEKNEWGKIIKKTISFALVEFIDQGVGMPEKIMNHIFQPFFTTKEHSKGTGLGLSICSDIALRHGGNLMVKSGVNKGATFQFILPIKIEE